MSAAPRCYRDRRQAGRVLATRLAPELGGRSDLLVLALPRGGVPVAAEVAAALEAPLDVFVVRKLGLPTRPELAMGAIATGGALVVTELASQLGVSHDDLAEVIAREQAELARRERAYRGRRAPPDPRGRTVVLVDDGLATGATMLAAVEALQRVGARSIVVAAPVGSASACSMLAHEVYLVVCPHVPDPFRAVGFAYDEFDAVTDDEVRAVLDAAREPAVRAPT